jgi:hypothetical protein
MIAPCAERTAARRPSRSYSRRREPSAEIRPWASWSMVTSGVPLRARPRISCPSARGSDVLHRTAGSAGAAISFVLPTEPSRAYFHRTAPSPCATAPTSAIGVPSNEGGMTCSAEQVGQTAPRVIGIPAPGADRLAVGDGRSRSHAPALIEGPHDLENRREGRSSRAQAEGLSSGRAVHLTRHVPRACHDRRGGDACGFRGISPPDRLRSPATTQREASWRNSVERTSPANRARCAERKHEALISRLKVRFLHGSPFGARGAEPLAPLSSSVPAPPAPNVSDWCSWLP